MKIVETKKAPPALGPYSQAIDLGNLIFTSGQIPMTSDGEVVSTNIEEQTHQVMSNLSAVLIAAGSSLDQVIKCTLFIKDMEQFSRINEVYAQYFQNHRPARSCVEVARLPKDVMIEIEAIAIKK